MVTSLPVLPETAVSALDQGDKIEAIKIVRSVNSIGLKAAKDLVEAHISGNPDLARKFPDRPAARIWIFVVLFALVVALAGYIFRHGK
jgi:hypothetical protein